MPVPQLWAILFFCMLLTLGMGSMFGNFAGVITPLIDLKVIPFRTEFLTGKEIYVLFKLHQWRKMWCGIWSGNSWNIIGCMRRIIFVFVFLLVCLFFNTNVALFSTNVCWYTCTCIPNLKLLRPKIYLNCDHKCLVYLLCRTDGNWQVFVRMG